MDRHLAFDEVKCPNFWQILRKHRNLAERPLKPGVMKKSMKKNSPFKARELIRKLNLLKLEDASYGTIKNKVSRLYDGCSSQAYTMQKGQRLYRGVIYQKKPDRTSFLGAPPKDRVTGYQRCNTPGHPMFYCSPDPSAIYYELGVSKGDRVYHSKWTVINPDFFINQLISSFPEKDTSQVQEIVQTYLETVFSQPVHETYSYQYKITAAISEVLTTREIAGDDQNRKMGGLAFPSVAHPKQSLNIVLFPDIAESCLSLDYVEEVQVTESKGKEISVKYTDISSNLDNGTISWSGKPKEWRLNKGEMLTITAEKDGWIARDPSGNVVDPT